MKTTFLYRQYAEDNGDLAELFGGEDDIALEDHFDRYGSRENRGLILKDYVTVEGVLASEQGHIYISGWADRRIVQTLNLTIEIGYMSYDLGEIDPIWYHREDVAGVTGDTERASGFLAILRIPDIRLHARMRILFNDKLMYQNDVMRWRSVDHFLTEALGACAQLADRPIGSSLPAANRLAEPLQEIWQEFLGSVSYTKAFEHRPGEEVDQSIIIALYRKADMLIPQLECLAQTLAETATEVIVVANQLRGSELVVQQLAGFCQMHDIRLQLYLCPQNSGFSAANNFGAGVARGEVLIFMNPDIFPPEKAPETALSFLTRDPGEALVGAMLYYGDGMLMHSGMYVAQDLAFDARSGLSRPVLRVEHFGKGLSHHIDDDADKMKRAMSAVRDHPFLVTAALWKIRKSVFEAMDGLSTDYLFAYYEDADFCLRMLQADRPIEIDETARWIHMEGVGKANPPNVRAFMWMNRAFFTERFAASGLVAPDDTDLFLL